MGEARRVAWSMNKLRRPRRSGAREQTMSTWTPASFSAMRAPMLPAARRTPPLQPARSCVIIQQTVTPFAHYAVTDNGFCCPKKKCGSKDEPTKVYLEGRTYYKPCMSHRATGE